MQDEIRLLGPGDETALDRFLAVRGEEAQLLRANLSRGGIVDKGAPYEGTYAGRLRRGAVTSVAAHFWNGMVLLLCEDAPEQLARLVLEASGRRLSGLLGPWDQVLRVSRSLELPADTFGLAEPQQLMTLDLDSLVVPEPLSAGVLVCRRPRSSELELLYNWRIAFLAETLGISEDVASRRAVRHTIDRLQAGGDNWVLTRGGCLVAYCGVIGETGEAVQIGGVNTPPDWRNRGYGRAVVAGALSEARERGCRRALLFTGNPAARRAYEAVGFAAAGEVGLVVLEAA